MDKTLGQGCKALYIYSKSWAMGMWLYIERQCM